MNRVSEICGTPLSRHQHMLNVGHQLMHKGNPKKRGKKRANIRKNNDQKLPKFDK